VGGWGGIVSRATLQPDSNFSVSLKDASNLSVSLKETSEWKKLHFPQTQNMLTRERQ
jgi:hypothetical protein